MKERFLPYRELVVDLPESVSDVVVDQVKLIETDGRQARFRFDRRQVSAPDLIAELVRNHPVKDVSVVNPEIETIVREIYERSALGERLLDGD